MHRTQHHNVYLRKLFFSVKIRKYIASHILVLPYYFKNKGKRGCRLGNAPGHDFIRIPVSARLSLWEFCDLRGYVAQCCHYKFFRGF